MLFCVLQSFTPLGEFSADDLYASLDRFAESSFPDVMGTGLSQIQDMTPLHTYGSIGLPTQDDIDGIGCSLGQVTEERHAMTAGPLAEEGLLDDDHVDLGASKYAWYVLIGSCVGVNLVCRSFGNSHERFPRGANIPCRSTLVREKPRYCGITLWFMRSDVICFFFFFVCVGLCIMRMQIRFFSPLRMV